MPFRGFVKTKRNERIYIAVAFGQREESVKIDGL